MRAMLYYPSILIPSDWIKRTVLYSDKISSIYPESFIPHNGQKEQQAHTDMMYLKDEGIYEYMRPEYLRKCDFNNILNDLMHHIDNATMETLRESFSKPTGKYEIYLCKMNEEIQWFLLENKIAKYNLPKKDSFLVEENIALLYMSLLAYYSAAEGREYSISTDENKHQSILFKSCEGGYDNYLNIVLNEIPQPSEQCSLEDIVNFKLHYRDELLDYRKFISSWIHIVLIL